MQWGVCSWPTWICQELLWLNSYPLAAKTQNHPLAVEVPLQRSQRTSKAALRTAMLKKGQGRRQVLLYDDAVFEKSPGSTMFDEVTSSDSQAKSTFSMRLARQLFHALPFILTHPLMHHTNLAIPCIPY